MPPVAARASNKQPFETGALTRSPPVAAPPYQTDGGYRDAHPKCSSAACCGSHYALGLRPSDLRGKFQNIKNTPPPAGSPRTRTPLKGHPRLRVGTFGTRAQPVPRCRSARQRSYATCGAPACGEFTAARRLRTLRPALGAHTVAACCGSTLSSRRRE